MLTVATLLKNSISLLLNSVFHFAYEIRAVCGLRPNLCTSLGLYVFGKGMQSRSQRAARSFEYERAAECPYTTRFDLPLLKS